MMTNLKSLFNTFSKSPEASMKAKHEIPQTTRNRVLLWCRELYSNSRTDLGTVGRGDCNAEFWQEIHARLLMRTGRLQLSETVQSWSGQEATKYDKYSGAGPRVHAVWPKDPPDSAESGSGNSPAPPGDQSPVPSSRHPGAVRLPGG